VKTGRYLVKQGQNLQNAVSRKDASLSMPRRVFNRKELKVREGTSPGFNRRVRKENACQDSRLSASPAVKN
jgi:hypothetical protein